MGFFRTKDPKTGEPRLGAGVYLIICGLMIGGVILWNTTKDNNSGIPKEQNSQVNNKNKSSFNLIASAAQNHDEKLPELEESALAQGAQSDRNISYAAEKIEEVKIEEESIVDTVDDTFDVLRQSQERSEREKAAAVARAREEARNAAQAEIDRLKALAEANAKPVPTAETSRRVARHTAPKTTQQAVAASEEDPEIVIDKKQLVVYDIAQNPKPQNQETVRIAQPTGFETGQFLPRGYMFPVYILSTVQTVGQEDMVVMAVAENVVFQHKVQLPFGTRLLGQGAATSFEDRIAINVDTILYPDGRELPISAFLKDPFDLSSGVRGYYIPQPLRVQLTPYVNEFLATWLEATVDRYSNNQDSDNGDSDEDSRVSALEGGSDLIRDQARKIQDRLNNRFPEKVVIPIGTKAYVQLRSALDLTQAAVAGSFNNTQPILPGFENNPIRPSGVVEKVANEDSSGGNMADIYSALSAGLGSSTPQIAPNFGGGYATPSPTSIPGASLANTPTASEAEIEEYLKALESMSSSLNEYPSGDIE